MSLIFTVLAGLAATFLLWAVADHRPVDMALWGLVAIAAAVTACLTAPR